MKTDQEIIDDAVSKASQELHLPMNGCIDKLNLLRMWKALYSVHGGDAELMRHWLNTHNNHLGFNPASRLCDEYSLNKIISYLEYFANI